MSHSHVLIITHLHSGFEYLNRVLDNNPRVAATYTNMAYNHPTTILFAQEQMSKFKHICADTLLYNHALTCKSLYGLCKFIYLVRSPEETLGLLPHAPQGAVNYYRFRLQRMAEMAKKTPDSLLLTWDQLKTQEAFPLLEKFLGLKAELKARSFEEEVYNPFPQSLINLGKRAYKKYLNKMVESCPNIPHPIE